MNAAENGQNEYVQFFQYNMFRKPFLIFALTMPMVIVESKQFEIKEFENPTVSFLVNSNVTSKTIIMFSTVFPKSTVASF